MKKFAKNRLLGENGMVAYYGDEEARHVLNDPIEANPIVDPAAARDLLIDDDFVPQNVNDLVIGVATLLRSIPGESVGMVYKAIKNIVQNNASDAINDIWFRGEKKGEETMKKNKNTTLEQRLAEQKLRNVIRKIIREDVFNEKRDEDDDFDVDDVKNVKDADEMDYAAFGKVLDDIDPRPTGEPWSNSGVKQAIDKSVRKFSFLTKLAEEDPEKYESMVWDAVDDYIKFLEKSVGKEGPDGEEVTPEDIEFLRKHPEAVEETDDFRKFLDKYVRRAGYNSRTDYNPKKRVKHTNEEE